MADLDLRGGDSEKGLKNLENKYEAPTLPEDRKTI